MASYVGSWLYTYEYIYCLIRLTGANSDALRVIFALILGYLSYGSHYNVGMACLCLLFTCEERFRFGLLCLRKIPIIVILLN